MGCIKCGLPSDIDHVTSEQCEHAWRVWLQQALDAAIVATTGGAGIVAGVGDFPAYGTLRNKADGALNEIGRL